MKESKEVLLTIAVDHDIDGGCFTHLSEIIESNRADLEFDDSVEYIGEAFVCECCEWTYPGYEATHVESEDVVVCASCAEYNYD